MAEPGSISSCVAAIKRLNVRFRALKNKDGPLAFRLMSEKDRLIDLLAALCLHPEVIGTRGAKSWGPMKAAVGPRRLCAKCGLCEAPSDGSYDRLARATSLHPLGEYLARQGAILKRLGINL
ncbi:MAG: hypothetical protein RL272_1129 [Candidatus Parcubacteria bacterium]